MVLRLWVRVDRGVVPISVSPHCPEIRNFNLSIRCNLVFYPEHTNKKVVLIGYPDLRLVNHCSVIQI